MDKLYLYLVLIKQTKKLDGTVERETELIIAEDIPTASQEGIVLLNLGECNEEGILKNG